MSKILVGSNLGRGLNLPPPPSPPIGIGFEIGGDWGPVPKSLYIPGVLQLIISFLSTWGGLKLRIHSPPGSQSTWKSVKTFRKDFRLRSTKLKLKLKEPG